MTYGSGGLDTVFWLPLIGWLVLLFLAGVLAARRTGTVQAAAGAGLLAGLISGLVYTVAGSVLFGLLLPPVGQVCFYGCAPPPPPSLAKVEDEIINGMVFSVLPAAMFGVGCGLLGGLLGLLLHRLRKHDPTLERTA